MKTKATRKKLQKNSPVFLPLGLVLILFTVYGLFESRTIEGAAISKERLIDDSDPYDFPQQIEVNIERPTSTLIDKVAEKPKVELIDEIEISDNPVVLEILKPFDLIDEKNSSESEIVFEDVSEPEKLEDDSHLLMDLVEEVPIYPGCEKGNNIEKRICLERKLRNLVKRKFNGDIVNSLGLSSGNKNIYVKFLITKTGIVEVIASKAPHIRLEKEGERVVRLLPKMEPGRQNGRAVNVSYMIPISVKVD